MIITEDILLQGMSRNGSYSCKQIRMLGSHIKKNKGWRRRLIGTSVPEANIKRFISLKDTHLPQIGSPGDITPLEEIKQLKEVIKRLKKDIKILTNMVK